MPVFVHVVFLMGKVILADNNLASNNSVLFLQETEEVCGTDNKTYSSVCALRDTACREKRRTHIKHMGSCGKSY